MVPTQIINYHNLIATMTLFNGLVGVPSTSPSTKNWSPLPYVIINIRVNEIAYTCMHVYSLVCLSVNGILEHSSSDCWSCSQPSALCAFECLYSSTIFLKYTESWGPRNIWRVNVKLHVLKLVCVTLGLTVMKSWVLSEYISAPSVLRIPGFTKIR